MAGPEGALVMPRLYEGEVFRWLGREGGGLFFGGVAASDLGGGGLFFWVWCQGI